jgi:hypothetical protein
MNVRLSAGLSLDGMSSHIHTGEVLMTGLGLFTLLHVAISLLGILSGVVVSLGFLSGAIMPRWNALFLWATILTSVTGFFFPFHGVTPGIAVGIVSIILLVPGVLAYREKWTRSYIVLATGAEFLNVLVLIAQLFQKIHFLHRLAPKGNEPIVAGLEACALLVFTSIAWQGIRRARYFLVYPTPPMSRSATGRRRTM